MHPSSIMSYYATYSILDEVVAENNYKNLNIYIDFRNCLQSIYMEHTIINLIESTRAANIFDTSIFSSLISFLSFHKLYSVKRKIKLNIFVFFEMGRSFYHQNISKKYKISRRVDSLYGLDSVDRELFHDIVRNNLILAHKAANGIPNVNMIRLLNLEADFIPYYLITRNIVDNSTDTAHITYSNDHDLCQNLGEHSYVFRKTPQFKKIVRKGGGMREQLKFESDLDDDVQSLAIAVIGDPGDDVDGIKGIGPKTFVKIAPDLLKMCGGMNQLYNNVMLKQPIFYSPGEIKNKYINKVLDEEIATNKISNNLKLVSFELLSRHFDDPDTTEMLSRKNEFLKKLSEKVEIPLERMKDVLELHNIDIEWEDLDILYQTV